MATQQQVVVDCDNRAGSAEFWAAALDYVVQPPGRRPGGPVGHAVARLVALGARVLTWPDGPV